MNLKPRFLWPVVLALGWLLDFLFWKQAPGINFALYALLCLAAGLYVITSGGVRPARRALWLAPLALFFAAVTLVRAEPLTRLLATGATLALMALFAITYAKGSWVHFRALDYVADSARLLASVAVRPLFHAEELRTERKSRGETGRSPWPVVRGILLALPVLAVFAALLASADLVFGQHLDEFIKLFNLERLPEYLFRLAYILAAAYALAGVFLHAATQSAKSGQASEKPLGVGSFLGMTEAGIVMGSVAVLFAMFVLIQFRYFFGGQANISAAGFTYSEYARRGFGELVAVALITLVLLMVLSSVTRRESAAQRRTFSGLGALLVILVMVMLVSAYQRLLLYEEAYGFSRLRAYTHVFLVWIGLLLAATAVLEVLKRELAFTFALVITALGFAASLAFLNVDAFIVTHNVGRENTVHVGGSARETAELDAHSFVQLSDDGTPALVRAFLAPETPAPVKTQLGVALSCIRYLREQREGAGSAPWQSFHLARYSADQALSSLGEALEAYRVEEHDRTVLVTVPSGGQFTCRGDYVD